MNRSSILYLVFILSLIFAISCSGGNGNVTAPDPMDRDAVSGAQDNGTLCMGLWQVVADKATGNVDIVQLRSADKVINVLGFMEPPPLTSMDLDWDDLIIDFDNNWIDVGVILSHPIPDDVFTGFDVRGICFGPEVTNADGLTIVTGPEYFTDEPFGYWDGLLGAPDSYGNYVGLAGYKYFCGDLDEDDVLSDFFTDPANYANRGSFPAGETVQRNYNLDWNGTGYDILVFNYAIYANYDWPIGEEPWDVDDWSITSANSAEAFCISVTETANSLWFSDGSGGGAISLDIEVWDWQGDISGVTIESVEAGIITQTPYDATYPNVGAFTTYMYEFDAAVATPVSSGDLDILITVTDAKTFGESWFLDLLSTGNAMYGEQIYNCFTYATNVMECPAPTVTAITPDTGEKGADIDDATIDGSSIMDGSMLGAILRMADESDIVGTDVQFISDTQITADFSLIGAEKGDWHTVIVNGCSTESNETDVLFAITGGGLTIKDTGPLPSTLPVANEKNFCVVANDTFDEEGIYYFTDDVGYDISYYDLTYSGASTLKGTLVDPFFGNIGGLLINPAMLGSIECPPMGGAYWCNRQTGLMPAWGNPADGPVWWSSPVDFPNLTNGYLYYDMRFVDLEYDAEDAGKIWGFWVNNTAGVDGATYYDPAPYNSTYYSITAYFPVDHSSAGVDGQISELYASRFGIDNNTNSDLLTAPANMMWYYIENDPGNPSVEVAGNADTFAYFQPKYTIDDDELAGLPIDVSTLNNYEDDDFVDVEFNWACILEDYQDGTWCVSVWEWDGTAMQLIERTGPVDGIPYNLDCDTTNQEIHVWAGDTGTDYYWIFEWS